MDLQTMGIAEAKRLLSEIVNRVLYRGDRIILQSRGRTKAALISVEDLRRLEQLEGVAGRDVAQPMAVLARARALRESMPAEPAGTATADLEHLRRERLDGGANLR